MNTKLKARKTASRTAHAPNKPRASARWTSSQRTHRVPALKGTTPAGSPKGLPDAETV